MFPEGVITREIEVGPASDLVSGVPYAIRVMVQPSRSVVWNGSPVVSSLKTYTIPAGETGTIVLPVTDQDGYSDGKGGHIELGPGEHAFYYRIKTTYLRNGSVVKTLPNAKVLLPDGVGAVDIDEMVQYSAGSAGGVISIPDSWSSIIEAAASSALTAEEAAEAAQEALEEYLSNPVDPAIIAEAVNGWFDENPIDAVTSTELETAISAHEADPAPHRAYDLDIPSLTVLFENGLA